MWRGDQILLTISIYVLVFMQSLKAHENHIWTVHSNSQHRLFIRSMRPRHWEMSSFASCFKEAVNQSTWPMGGSGFNRTHALLPCCCILIFFGYSRRFFFCIWDDGLIVVHLFVDISIRFHFYSCFMHFYVVLCFLMWDKFRQQEWPWFKNTHANDKPESSQ